MADKYTNQKSDIAAFENLSKFDGFYNNRYFDPMVSGYGFIFITKPKLFISPRSKETLAYKNMCRDPYFAQFIENESFNGLDKYIPHLLSYVDFSDTGSFIPMFTNKLKNIETNDISLESTEAFETKQGYRMPMPTYTTQSEATSQITLSVTESANMDFTKLITLWVKYINNVTDGTFDANPEMIKNGVLDYTSSVYYFALAPDGRTIKYWCKYTGCWPTTIPYSAMRYNKGDIQTVELDIPFIYTVKEDLSPAILEDFNIVSLKLQNSVRQVLPGDYTMSYISSNDNEYLNRDLLKNKVLSLGSMSAAPYVLIDNSGEKSRYVLMFDDNTNTGSFYKDVFSDSEEVYFDNGKMKHKKILEEDVDQYYFAINGDDSFFKL